MAFVTGRIRLYDGVGDFHPSHTRKEEGQGLHVMFWKDMTSLPRKVGPDDP